MSKTLGQIGAEGFSGEEEFSFTWGEADPMWRERWEAAADAVKKTVLGSLRWQPIETAPKDRPILAYGPDMVPEIHVVEYFALEMDDKDELGRPFRRVFSQGWAEAGGEACARFEPTHWMELPRGPE